MEIRKANELALIDSLRSAKMIGALGKETLVSIAKSENETQAKLLSGLGIKSIVMTDSKTPVNLMNLAQSN